MVKPAIFALTLLGLSSPCDGNAFLERQDSAASAKFLNQSIVEEKFLEEVRSFGAGRATKGQNVMEAKEALMPMWRALPKTDSMGKLGGPQVRYALHRFFVKRHGWHIHGLNQVRHTSANSTVVSKENVPSFLMDVFEEAFGKEGLLLHELAIFAATMEHLIKDEALERLKDVYSTMLFSMTTELTPEEADEGMRAYIASLMLGDGALESPQALRKGFDKLQRTYPGWNDMKMWLQDVRKNVAYQNAGTNNPFKPIEHGFKSMERIAEQVNHRIGSFQDQECRELKRLLLEAEDGESGRVRLTQFYKKGMETDMQFVEKPEYLRQLGALDESLPGEPRVIVPNYVLSQGNCLADVGFYSICCINECEALMSSIEDTIAAPQSSPERLAAAVANLSSSTVEASHQLPQNMLQKLEDIARRHGGQVPLHGRLFAQWLHFNFPRECPFPHMNGATNPLSANEWMQVTNEKANMMKREMREYIEKVVIDEKTRDKSKDAEDELLSRWSDEEELLYLPSTDEKASEVLSTLRSAVAVLGFGGVVIAGIDHLRRVGSLETLGLKEKAHMV